MDFSTVANLISNLGVPIALLFASFWLLDQERKDHKKEVDDLRQELGRLGPLVTLDDVVLERADHLLLLSLQEGWRGRDANR